MTGTAGWIAGIVSRAKVLGALRGRSTMLNLQLLATESRAAVQWLMPYGMTALPTAGDAIVLKVGGTRDDQVVINVDNPALRINDLKTGEFGFSDASSLLVFRQARLEIQSVRPALIQSDDVVTVAAGGAMTITAAGTISTTTPHLALTGDQSISGTMSVHGAVTFDAALTVNGSATIVHDVAIGGTLSVAGVIHAGGGIDGISFPVISGTIASGQIGGSQVITSHITSGGVSGAVTDFETSYAVGTSGWTNWAAVTLAVPANANVQIMLKCVTSDSGAAIGDGTTGGGSEANPG
jgi:phage gp45-like